MVKAIDGACLFLKPAGTLPQPGQCAAAVSVMSDTAGPGRGFNSPHAFVRVGVIDYSPGLFYGPGYGRRGARVWRRLLEVMVMALFLLTLGACREQAVWDPDVAVKVNGRPVPRAALDRALEWGFYPDLDQGGEREINIPLILDKLINEELILGEAEKEGLALSPAELNEGLDNLSSAWFGEQLPPAERAEFRQALARHLLLRKMTEKVINSRKILSAEKWRDFWEKWPKNKGPSFKVRALLLPPAEDEPEPPAELKRLEELADYFQNQGSAVVLSQDLWLYGERLDLVISEELNRAFKEKRLSLPVRLDESWAIYETLARDLGPSAAEEFDSARKAFETQAGEEAFQKWLAEIRSEAVIEYAPSLGLPEAPLI